MVKLVHLQKKGKPAIVDFNPQPKQKERKPIRRYKTTYLNIGKGHEEYCLMKDMKERTAHITFAQLLGMCPKLKREWKRLASPKKVKEQVPTRGEMVSIEELPDICPFVTTWCKGFNIGEEYIDGGAQISVMTHACMEKLELKVDGSSDFKLRLANHAKVKCLGRCMNVLVTVYGVTCNVNCHIMPAGLGAYPLILGRPWLRQVGAIQNWKEGIIIVHNKRGKARQFDMQSK